MPQEQIIYVPFNGLLRTHRNTVLQQQQHFSFLNRKKRKISADRISDSDEREAERTRDRLFLWPMCPCCASLSPFVLFIVACLVVTVLVLVIVLPTYFILVHTATTEITKSFTTKSITTIMNSTISILNNTTNKITMTSTTTTPNICVGSFAYSTLLFFLDSTVYLPWTSYKFNYTSPNVTAITLMFSFRNDPVYWYLADVSVKNSSGVEILLNGDFQYGSLANWVYCNPNNASHAGAAVNLTSLCGGYCYQDGSVGAPDYLSQTFNAKPNSLYTISFRLTATGDNSTFARISIFY